MNEAKKTILIVDDVEEVCDAIALILEDPDKYNTLTAGSGKKAIALLETELVDLMIVDILMPEMDGIELVETVQNIYPELKIILISGGGRQEEPDSGYDYLKVSKELTGITNAIKKPIKAKELLDLVEKLI